IRFAKATPGAKPFLDFVALVDSPLPLLLETVTATINGRPISTTEVIAPTKEQTAWSVRLNNVPLVEGVNTVTLTVSNRDAAARKPGVTEVTFKPPEPPKPPTAVILEPQSET